MHIEKLRLHSDNIDQQVSFFRNILGLVTRSSEGLLSIDVGTSVLEFVDSPVDGKYHYCFLIPSNQIEEAKEWLSKRLDLIEVEENNFIANFESWNAHSIYFYDGNGNIAELIARHDLQNESQDKFGIQSLISINEIGTPHVNPRALDRQLQSTIGSLYWKGDLDRFSTHGDQYGLFLIPNYKIKKTWFPTEIEVKPLPYSSTIVQDSNKYLVQYINEKLLIDLVNNNP